MLLNNLICFLKLWDLANPFLHARVHGVTTYKYIPHTVIAIQLQHLATLITYKDCDKK